MTNSQDTPMTATATLDTVRPMGDWFTALSTDIQGDIMEMVNEAGYPLGDIQDFVETYGAQAYADGHYVTWCELTEDGHDDDAVKAFVDEFGVENLEHFEDTYRGQYDSEADFAEQHTDDLYTMGHMPDWVVVDWQATWDTSLRYSYVYNNGYVFMSDW